jgi:hypothetical protein
VKDTATLAMLTVAATCPMVCAIATCFSRPRNNSRQESGQSNFTKKENPQTIATTYR